MTSDSDIRMAALNAVAVRCFGANGWQHFVKSDLESGGALGSRSVFEIVTVALSAVTDVKHHIPPTPSGDEAIQALMRENMFTLEEKGFKGLS